MHSKVLLRQLSLQVLISAAALEQWLRGGADNQHGGVLELDNARSLLRFEEHTSLGFSSFESVCLHPATLESSLQQALTFQCVDFVIPIAELVLVLYCKTSSTAKAEARKLLINTD